MLDPGIMLVDSPVTVTVVGRSKPEDSYVNGQYHITDKLDSGRPVYVQMREDTSPIYLRYNNAEDVWMITPYEMGNDVIRAACACALGASHPGFAGLEWHFCGPQKVWAVDPAVCALVAPIFVHVIGRDPGSANGKINGTYQLAGARDGRPIYVKPGTRSLIRYSPKHDWWLINADGLQEPSVLTRIYQWILSGDSSAAENQCSAYCKALNTEHPGHCCLEWSVWDNASGRHMPDPRVRVTDAPTWLQVAGRHPKRLHANINGDYFMFDSICGRPAYQQRAQCPLTMMWHGKCQRWVVSQDLRGDGCVAYCDDLDEDCPTRTQTRPVWRIYERQRGEFVTDMEVHVTEPPGAQSCLQVLSTNTGEHGLYAKRVLDGSSGRSTKRRRLCGDTGRAEPVLGEQLLGKSRGSARSTSSITSRIAGFFGA